MADRYDPKLSVRPMTDRKAGDGRPAQPAGEDPLFELAKLVSGRAGAPAPTAPPPKGRTVPATEALPTAAEQADALADLEAELLSDLQASFASVKNAVSAPPLAPEPSPPPQQAAPPPPAPKPAEPALRAPSPPPAAPAPAPQPPRFAAARPPLQAAPPTPQPVSKQPDPHPVPPPRLAPSNENRVDIANLQLRPTVPPAVNPPPAPQTPSAEVAAPTAKDRASRWDRPPEPVRSQPSAASRFAPQRTATSAPVHPAQPVKPPPATENLDELPFGDGPPLGMEAEGQEDEFSLEGFDLGPALAEEDQIPPYPDEELAGLGRRRFPRGAAILAGIVAVVVVGGAAAMFLRPGTSGTATAPVILADTSPTKVAPPASPAPAAGADNQNKLIYDRVDSRNPAVAADTKLVKPGTEPIGSVPAAGNDSAISRVILPGGPQSDGKPAPAATGAQAPSAGDTDIGADGKPIGPRKVRTVVVKPDGTIVSSEAAPADAAANGVAPALPPAQNDDTAAIAGQKSGQELAITPIPGTPTSLPPQTGPAKPQPATPVVRNDPPAAKPAQPQQPQAKVVNGASPIDLTPAARPAARPPAAQAQPQAPLPLQQQAALPPQQGQPAPAANGGMLVQVSSQRSEDAARATYRDLQARYPNVLGTYPPNIQRADLGDRGVYYRVRVGPLAGNDAQRLCDALKSAGGDCVLAAR